MDSPGKNTGVGCHFLLQGMFLTQGLNSCLLLWQAGSLPTELPGKPEQGLSPHQMDHQHPHEADRQAESKAGAQNVRRRWDSYPAPAFHSRCAFVKPGSKPTQPYSLVLKPEDWEQLGIYAIENDLAV